MQIDIVGELPNRSNSNVLHGKIASTTWNFFYTDRGYCEIPKLMDPKLFLASLIIFGSGMAIEKYLLK